MSERVFTKEQIQKVVDDVIREEYGGCHPFFDNPCKIKIRVHREPPWYRCIEYFVVGKWRAPRYYGGNKDVVTNKTIMKEVEKILRCNTGKTFEGKKIEWDWQPVYTGN
jgi:hypothetical protein